MENVESDYELAALSVIVHGAVQGVGYRNYVWQVARDLNLTGYVRNLQKGGDVEVHAEGERPRLDALLLKLQGGPRGAKVDKLDAEWSEFTAGFSQFEVRF